MEDNVTNQNVALSILEKIGCQADTVANGLEALESLKVIDYDLVLMDCQMPEMDGYEATRAVRSQKSAARNRDVPIVAMTAQAMGGDRQRCLDAGMDDYISKPVQPQNLARVIAKWLPGGSSQPSLSEVSKPAAGGDTFDKADLMDRLMGDEKLAVDIISGFVKDVPHRLAAINEGLNEGDALIVRREAHTLKGACANLGAPAMKEAASCIEASAAKQDLAGAATLLPELEEQFEKLKDAFSRNKLMSTGQ